ncbi:MAG: type II toxin-antitoxin system HicB family antitoxin [Methylobacter sp.]|nr:type II toxin-antitoxin system HicB family antitoxin [Methylobacter sp.]
MKIAVVLHSDDGQRYGVTVPDLAGCFSAGDSIDDALGVS